MLRLIAVLCSFATALVFAGVASAGYNQSEPPAPTSTTTAPTGDQAQGTTEVLPTSAVEAFGAPHHLKGTIVVKKKTFGGTGTFDFTLTSPWGHSKAFSLTTTAEGVPAVATFDKLWHGKWSLTETVPEGWELKNAWCDDGSTPDNIWLDKGETVVCWFEDKKRDPAKIIIIKKTLFHTGTFNFTGDLGPFSLTTTHPFHPVSKHFDVTAGTYRVAEEVPLGWELIHVKCSDGSDPATGIVVSSGEVVKCLFVNKKKFVDPGTIIIKKITHRGKGTFEFTSPQLGNFSLTTTHGHGEASTTFPNLKPGSYSVTENVPHRWRLKSATCDDGSSPSNIGLDPGETVTCTFVNKKVRWWWRLHHHKR